MDIKMAFSKMSSPHAAAVYNRAYSPTRSLSSIDSSDFDRTDDVEENSSTVRDLSQKMGIICLAVSIAFGFRKDSDLLKFT